MLKRLWKVALWLIFILPDHVMAQGIDLGMQAEEIFRVEDTDPTKAFLAQIFGTVGTVLHGTTGQLLGQIFRVFNIGILLVGGIFFIWAIVQTIISTAHEGQFMGASKSKPAFTILRTVAGFGLLVPSFTTGYSTIQVMVMWVILQGVGFANTGWNAALTYFEQGGIPLATPATNTGQILDMAGTVLAAQVCMYNAEKEEQEKQRDAIGGTPDAAGFPAYRPIWVGNNAVRFPKARGNKDAGCGQFTWQQGDPSRDQYMRSALQQVIIGTQSVAKRLVDPGGLDSKALERLTENAVIGAAADWTNILLPLRNLLANIPGMQQMQQQLFQKMRQSGWMYAGAYYLQLSSLQGVFLQASSTDVALSSDIHGTALCSGSDCRMIYFSGKDSIPISQDASPQLAQNYRDLAVYVTSARAKAVKIDAAATGMPAVYMGAAGPLSPLMGQVTLGISSALSAVGGGPQGVQLAAVDPILKLKAAGEKMVETVAIIMIVGVILVSTISALASIFSSVQSAGYAIRDALTFLLALLTPFLVLILIEGSIMATYLPLIPFIIYTFAVIGWLIIVIETLVAAPIVALGLTHPEGHDLMGASQQAMMLLLNVFLRPILMITGLFAGMILSKIGLQILTHGFVYILTNGPTAINGWFALAFLLIYIALVIQVLTMTYGLITHIPDRVMRWVGVAPEQTPGVMEALGGAKAASGKVAQAGGESFSGGTRTGGALGTSAPAKAKSKAPEISAGAESGKGDGGGGKGKGKGKGKGEGEDKGKKGGDKK